MLLAYGISAFLVKPEGSKRTWENFSTSASKGTPYWSAIEIEVAKAPIRPEMVEPSLAITRKISPGLPSSYMQTVMYPSWPAMENLWVMDLRSSGSLRRAGRGPAASAASSFEVLSGWLRLQPSRYTATAFSPNRHDSRYAFAISSGVASAGMFSVFEIAP